jgi:type I restriction enzyme S subunit
VQTQAYQTDDVLVSNIRPYFKKIWFANRDGGCSNDVLVMRAKEGCDPGFLYYLLSDDNFFDYATATAKGTKMPRGDKGAIMHYEVPDLPMDTQIGIAGTLSVLDARITENKAVNNHLEQMAQAIFKSWFVDFEPWGGVMPADWREGTLGDLCTTITKGTTPTTLKKQFVPQGINFVKAESILADHSLDFSKLAYIDNETNFLLNRSVIKENDIIFTIAGTLGRFAFVGANLLPANTNQAIAIIRADTSKINPVTLYSFFVGGLHSDFYTKNIQQAVQANLSLTTIKALPLLLPPTETLLEYSALIAPLFEQMFQNYNENRHLAALRYTLLPRLMSGELEITI